MDRFQPLDVSNSSLGAHLYPTEEVLLLTPSVGLYSGPTKSLPHASGTVYLTSHRLFYVDDTEPHKHSCFVALSLIRETQFFAGFLKSSPKITVGFRARDDEDVKLVNGTVTQHDGNGSASGNRNGTARASEDWRVNATTTDASASLLPTTSWVCRVCAFSNTLDPGVDRSSSVRCALCGVSTEVKDLALQASQMPSTTTPVHPISAKRSSPLQSARAASLSEGVACPTCTFKNHPSMLRCEMCDASLATEADFVRETNGGEVATAAKRQSSAASLTASRTSTPFANRTPNSKTPEPEEQVVTHNHIRLSFRKGGDRPFYDTLKTTLKDKRWQRSGDGASAASGTTPRSSQNTLSRRRFIGGAHANIDGRSAAAPSDDEGGGGGGGTSTPSRRVGIEGIMSAVDLQSREESSDMQDALRDLEALMMRAKKMVDFAEALNAKLNRQESGSGVVSGGAGGSVISSTSNDEAATTIRSSLVRLGLPTPAITSDMARDQHEFNVQLARELAGLLYASRRPLLGKGKVLVTPVEAGAAAATLTTATDESISNSSSDGLGILPLDEVWCLWNRARGVALVSPKELLAVLPFLPRLTVPSIVCKTFASGVKVLHTPRFAELNLSARVYKNLQAQQHEADRLLKHDDDEDGVVTRAVGLSTLELARLETCPLHLMSELLGDVERSHGLIVRDEYRGQVIWYLNRFTPMAQGAVM